MSSELRNFLPTNLLKKIDATIEAFPVITSSRPCHRWPRASWPFSHILKVNKPLRRIHQVSLVSPS